MNISDWVPLLNAYMWYTGKINNIVKLLMQLHCVKSIKAFALLSMYMYKTKLNLSWNIPFKAYLVLNVCQWRDARASNQDEQIENFPGFHWDFKFWKSDHYWGRYGQKCLGRWNSASRSLSIMGFAYLCLLSCGHAQWVIWLVKQLINSMSAVWLYGEVGTYEWLSFSPGPGYEFLLLQRQCMRYPGKIRCIWKPVRHVF